MFYNLIKVLSALLVAFFVNFAIAKEKQPELKMNTVLANIDGQKIFVRDVVAEIQTLPANVQASLGNNGFNQIRDDLIRKVIINKYVKKNKLHKTEAYKTALIKAERDLAVQIFIANQVQNIKISENDYKKEYEAYKQQLKNLYHYRAKHILVKEKKQARKIIALIKKGKKFDDLAKKYSIDPSKSKGGDLGYFNLSEMDADFAKGIEALKVGKYTLKPIKSQYGYHVAILIDKKKATLRKLEEMKPIFKENIQKVKISKVVDNIVNKAKIKVYDGNGKEIK